jgi:glycerophosphoryl diester phosphodiesterase
VAFAESRSLVDVYSPITLGQLFDFLREYESYYATGKGAALPVAAARLRTVKKVHLNIETKVHEVASFEQWRRLTDLLGRLADTTALRSRVTLQSFDWRSVALAQEKYPWLQTVVLMDESTFAGPLDRRAGLPWPEAPPGPVAVQKSGGFEGLALSADGTHLLALLEKPLKADRTLEVFSFSLASRQFEGVAFRFPLAPGATAVGDFTMASATEGLALERDDGDGAAARHKWLVHFTVGAPGAPVRRDAELDLLRLSGPDGKPFSFPFITPEGVALRQDGTIAVINDNNFPFGRARSADAPDPTELLLLTPP